MMAEITYQMVLSTVQTAGILVGIAYYIMTLNYTRRNQEQTLKTRHATIYNQLMGPIVTPIGIKNLLLLQETPFSNYEEWSKLTSRNPEYNEAWIWMCNIYESAGINLIEGVANIDYFARHNPWWSADFWRQYKPIIYEMRKNRPRFYQNMEYAMDSLEKYLEEHPELSN